MPKRRSVLHLYRSYNFVNKDPVIDGIRTMIQDEGLKQNQVHVLSGVAATTLHNWLDGPTQQPRFSTIAAVAASMGYNRMEIKNGTVRFEKVRDLDYRKEIDKAGTEIVKANTKPAKKRQRRASRRGTNGVNANIHA
ncbi:MAG TPA: hypothetical protein VGH62_01495 [Bradyrhizobium sp.]|jgi:hypothetical protein